MKKLIYVLIIGIIAAFYIGCSDDDDSPTKPKPDTVLKVLVNGIFVTDTTEDTTAVSNSNVVVYEAETGQAVMRDLTNDDGVCYFKLDPGNYYLNVTAQGYYSSPAPNVTAVPFFVTAQDTSVQTRFLSVNEIADPGTITGSIDPAAANFLVVADNGTEAFSTVSGHDGFFVLYNLPVDLTYSFSAYRSGYKVTSYAPETVALSGADSTGNVTIMVDYFEGYTLTGKMDMRATEDSSGVDVVLRDPRTKSVIPGLKTRTYINPEAKAELGDYTLSGIPEGDFIAWASLENDGYVLDPDWLFQNPDGLNLSYPADSIKVLNFPCTGSIKIVSPTNPMDSIYAVEADSATPEFKWVVTSSCSSRKEWFLEVRDINGNIMWGGFNADGTVNHDFIGPGTADTLSVSYNFDGRGNALVPGEIYQWRIWADGGTNQDSFVQNLISASEDLMGLFKVVLPPPEPVK
ncbi:MAG: carboxypeptidase-like regulatory domain-containing protein [Candidatus Delongbacteria bacterium]